jgi:hypothetical protein
MCHQQIPGLFWKLQSYSITLSAAPTQQWWPQHSLFSIIHPWAGRRDLPAARARYLVFDLLIGAGCHSKCLFLTESVRSYMLSARNYRKAVLETIAGLLVAIHYHLSNLRRRYSYVLNTISPISHFICGVGEPLPAAYKMTGDWAADSLVEVLVERI